MSKASAEAAVRGLIVHHLGVDESRVTDDAHFLTDLGGDSLDCVELAMDIEDYFGIEVPDVDAEKIRTLKGWIDYLATRIEQAA